MTDPVETLVRGVSFFRSLDRVDIARLTGALEQVAFAAGDVVFAEGDEADALYLLDRGRIAISLGGPAGERRLVEAEGPGYFGEMGLLLARRTASVRAVTDILTWKLSRERFDRVARERPGVGLAIATALANLVDRRSREYAGVSAVEAVRPPVRLDLPRRAAPARHRFLGGIAAVGVPAVLWIAPPPGGLTTAGWHTGLIVLGAVLAWLAEPVPDFVAALAMVAAWGVAGLVPLPRALAGFTSPSFAIALSALGLAAAMVSSGLLYRTALGLLQAFPRSYTGQVLALLAGGLLTTPLMPLSLGRIAAIAPLTTELSEHLGYAPCSRGSAGLAFAAIFGYAAFSSVFFTGLAMNFYVFALLPEADRAHFSWLAWLAAAAPAGAVLLVGAGAILLGVFGPATVRPVSADALERQRRVLGPVTASERVTIVAIAVLIIGLAAEPVLRLDGTSVAMLALVVVLAGGVLGREAFRSSIDWGFLVLFGVLLGTGAVLHRAGIDRWIGAALIPAARSVPGPGLLVVLLGAAIMLLRLVLPWIPATLLLSLALVPSAVALGLSPWVVGFVVLVAANAWLLPRQSDYCRLVREATHGELFTERQAFVAGAALSGLTLLAIALSLPYWRFLGVLTP
jgi:DASS family divalent anion:Na+ symporter